MSSHRAPRLAFFYRSNFTKYDWDRFGLESFMTEGFSIEILQFNNLPGFEFLNDLVLDETFASMCVFPKTFEDLDRYLSKLSAGDVAVVTVGFERKTAWLFKLLTKNRIDYVVQSSNFQNSFRGWNFALDLRDLLRNKMIDARRLASQFLHFVSLTVSPAVNYLSLRSPAVNVRSGREPYELVSTFPHLHRVKTTIDVENPMCRQAYPEAVLQPALPERYAVFLDQNLPYHPDFTLLNMPAVDPGRYEAALQDSLSAIERRSGLPIVIAASPKKTKSRISFGGRRVVEGSTAQLVRGAALVIGHYSQAIGLAALFNKPTLFLTNQELVRCGLDRHVACFSSWLGSRRLRMESIEQELAARNNLTEYDDRRYRQYERTYLRVPGSVSDAASEVLAKQAKRLSEKELLALR